MTKNVKHVMHVVHRFDTGGLENGVVNLINTLDPSEYRHTIVALTGYSEAFCARVKTNNVEYFHLEKKEGNDVRIFFRLRKLIKRLKPDVLHTRNTATIETQLVGWWCRVPLRIHGEHGWDINDMHGQNRKYQMLRRFMSHYIHKYVALSTEALAYLQSTINIATQRIHHICNGVDIVKFAPRSHEPELFPKGFHAPDTIIFGTVGRLAAVKNQTLLLNAFIWLLGEESGVTESDKARLRLIIVGDGGLKASLVERAEQAGVSDYVWFAGNRSDIPALMNSLDVFVLPSLAEGISNTILEASASGLPVIATNVGGNPELLEASLKATHLVNVNDTKEMANAMKQYVVEPQLKQINSNLVREHCVKNFSIDTMVDKYHQLYQSTNH